MTKRSAARRAAAKRAGRGATGKGMLMALGLCLLASGLTWAGWGRLSAPYTAAPQPVSPPVVTTALPQQESFSPASPAKEYVYAGGRLVATEEPPADAPSDLRFIRTSQSCSNSVSGYLTWLDYSTDETGFVVERRDKVNNVWGAWYQVETLAPDVTQSSFILVKLIRSEFVVKALKPSGVSAPTNTVSILGLSACEASSCQLPKPLLISEFRLRGAAGPKDEFIELYNNSDTALTVCTTDTSGGWTVAARTTTGASAAPVFTIPNGTVIPARGHYLAANASPSGGYSLSQHPAGNGTTATGDIGYTSDLQDNSGIALFSTAASANFSAGTRLDAAGFAGATGAIPDLYREGPGLGSVGTQNGNYTLYRKMTSASGGLPQDTGNNASDFQLVDTNGGLYGSIQASLGAPGPENLSSPVQRNSTFGMTNLDTSQGGSVPPNRVRDFTMVPNGTFGTLAIRRTIYNYTGGNVTRLRFRLVSLTTWPAPSGTADLRALTSGDVQVQVQGVWRTVKGTTLEQPPSQPNGGGYHSAMSVALPQPLPPGATVDVQFLLGLQQTGGFTFLINIEALP